MFFGIRFDKPLPLRTQLALGVPLLLASGSAIFFPDVYRSAWSWFSAAWREAFSHVWFKVVFWFAVMLVFMLARKDD